MRKKKHTGIKLLIIAIGGGLVLFYHRPIQHWFLSLYTPSSPPATTSSVPTDEYRGGTVLVKTTSITSSTSVALVSSTPTAPEPFFFSGTKLAGSAAPLLSFSTSDYAQARTAHKLIVLYFYSDNDSNSRDEFLEITDAFNQLSTNKVVGFRVHMDDDFVSEPEFKVQQDFHVTSTTTKIFIKDGNELLRSTDSWGQEEYLNQLNKLLTTL
jgi:hypothetical protein